MPDQALGIGKVWYETRKKAKQPKNQVEVEMSAALNRLGGTRMRNDKTAWLIEGAGVYWYGTGLAEFGPDVNQAIRFCRQQDAEHVLQWIVPIEVRRVCRTAEHMLCDPAQPKDQGEPFHGVRGCGIPHHLLGCNCLDGKS